MTAQLRDALRELAEEVTEADHRPETGDLWRRGRRRRRRRATTTAVLACVALALVSGLPVVVESTHSSTAPASVAGSGLAVPDELWAPWSWGASADETSPPGALAIVARSDRSGLWPFAGTPTWFGVSAVDQSYRWLTPPDMSTQDPGEMVLSPDGRRLAYWLAGDPTSRTQQSDVVGYAVMDLLSGSVERHEVPTAHGLSVDQQGLVWSGDSSTLFADYDQWRKTPGSSRDVGMDVWEPANGGPKRLAVDLFFRGGGPGPEDSMVAWGGRDRLVTLTARGRSRVRVDRGPSNAMPTAPILSPAADRIAFVDARPYERGAFYSVLHVAQRHPDGAVGSVREVAPQWYANGVLGWLDDTTVLTEAFRWNSPGVPTSRILAVDVKAGTVSPGIHTPAHEVGDVQVATDLLGGRLVPGDRPSPLARTWRFAFLLVLTALLLAGLLRVWRGSRRRAKERSLSEARSG